MRDSHIAVHNGTTRESTSTCPSVRTSVAVIQTSNSNADPGMDDLGITSLGSAHRPVGLGVERVEHFQHG